MGFDAEVTVLDAIQHSEEEVKEFFFGEVVVDARSCSVDSFLPIDSVKVEEGVVLFEGGGEDLEGGGGGVGRGLGNASRKGVDAPVADVFAVGGTSEFDDVGRGKAEGGEFALE